MNTIDMQSSDDFYHLFFELSKLSIGSWDNNNNNNNSNHSINNHDDTSLISKLVNNRTNANLPLDIGNVTGQEEAKVVEEVGGFMSSDLQLIFEVMNFAILSGIICVSGSIFNIVNIIVFVRQGCRDSFTVSLLALAVSDFGALSTLVWVSICFNPYFAESDAIWINSPRVQYLTAGWPHVCFARITSFITAYITFERCLCVVLPLKVKNIFTPRRSFYVILAIFLVQMASVAPVYYAIRLDWVFHEGKNRTLIDLVYVEHGPFIENVSFSFNVVTQIISFIAVIICSLVIVHGLRVKAKWRRQAVVSGPPGDNDNKNGNSASVRDKKVVKMVLFLATVFIVCFLPSAVNLIVMIISPQYSIVGRYKNLFKTSWSFLNTLEATNSTINIFIYYRMSTKYRHEFQRLFCRDKLHVKDSQTSST